MIQSFYPKEIAGAIGVTKELTETECSIFQGGTRKFIYKNGIINSKQHEVDNLNEKSLEIMFMCGVFSGWQGFDRFVHEIKSYRGKEKIIAHIVGHLSLEQQAELLENSNELIEVIIHGYLDSVAYQKIISRCKYGIAPLAIDRMGVSESSSLKVREYLSNGLLVITNHFDIALNDKPYTFDLRHQEFSNLALHYERTNLTKTEIVELSYPYINKTKILERLLGQMTKEFP